MTPEELVAQIRESHHLVVVHRSDVFFNTITETEMLRWVKRGARAVPHYDDVEIANRRKKGSRTIQGWEVHVLGVCDPVYVTNDDGDEVNVTNDALLAAARA